MFNAVSVRAAVFACIASLFVAGNAVADSPRLQLDIAAGDLADALLELSQKYGANLVYRPDQVRGIRTRGVQGQFTTEEAAARLLEGTPLKLSTGANGSMLIAIPQSTNAPEPSAAAMPGQLEEIVVTAQKRVERLVDTPQSVSVLSAQTLARLGATQFRDFASTVPGLSFATSGAGFTQVTLRGVTAGFDIGSTVATYVDEVPYGSSSTFARSSSLALDVGLFDVDRIEVLRGPQGTLYGASAMGGLIKYVLRAPDAKELTTSVQSGLSTTAHGGVSYNGALSVNAPLVADKAALRLSGFHSRDGGYIDNTTLGQKDVNEADISGGRIDLLMTPTEALSVRLTGYAQNISREGEGTADYTLAGSPVAGELDQQRAYAEPFDQQFRLVSGTVTYDADRATLTAISSYQSIDSGFIFDLSAGYGPFCSFQGDTCSALGDAEDITTHKFAQELRLASNGSDSIEWLIGGFYTRETSDRRVKFLPVDLAGQPLPNGLFLFASPSLFKESAAFGDVTWHIAPKFDVTAGARHSWSDQTFTQVASGAFATDNFTRSSEEQVTTYLGNARYHFTDRATGYLRYATGYRPGGPNYVLNDPATGLPLAPPTFESDDLASYEIGFKMETDERTLSVDVAAYQIDWNNIQIATTRSGLGVKANARGGARIRGGELTALARPTPALMLTAALAYQDAQMADADAELGAARGDPLPNVPRFTAAFNGDYEFPSSGLRPTVGATVRFVDGRNASFDGSIGYSQYELPSYTSVDFRAGLRFGTVETQLFVHNAFDEAGQLSAFNWRLNNRGMPSIIQPRTIGVSATAHF